MPEAMFFILESSYNSHEVKKSAHKGTVRFNYYCCVCCSRTSSGKLHLVPDIGKIPLADALLIEDPTENPEDDGMRQSNVLI